MFDTRLIYQVVDWERRLEIENEKQKNQRPGLYTGFPKAHQACRKEQPSFLMQIFRHGLNRIFAIH